MRRMERDIFPILILSLPYSNPEKTLRMSHVQPRRNHRTMPRKYVTLLILILLPYVNRQKNRSPFK